jgi:D-tyrosyl-tRNA(Tyr) deacylase
MIHVPRQATFFFCCEPDKDPVARHVYEHVLAMFRPEDSGVSVDGHVVFAYTDAKGDVFRFVRTDEVVSHNYGRYLPLLNQYFADSDVAGLVNWHEGSKAPEAIFCVHTTGDVPSGHFGAAHPVYMRNLVRAIEAGRRELHLDEYFTTSEATHWSGIPYGGSPNLISAYPVPLMDVEIGSVPTSWASAQAAAVLAKALVRVFDEAPDNLRSLVAVGGIHFEASFAQAMLSDNDCPVAITHILANQWVLESGYDTDDGLAKFEACLASVRGGVDGLVFHDNLKGPIKAVVRQLAERRGIPAFKHHTLRRPHDLPLW